MGGEKGGKTALMVCQLGSPPRGRGKERLEEAGETKGRITPALAGKSRFSRGCAAWSRDHPRVGGEKASSTTPKPAKSGSPPRGRGKVHGLDHGVGHGGITPAWAGKSGQQLPPLSPPADHPRVGGEKWVRRESTTEKKGSPPRGRGKVGPHTARKYAAGITPA